VTVARLVVMAKLFGKLAHVLKVWTIPHIVHSQTFNQTSTLVATLRHCNQCAAIVPTLAVRAG
jgi:hypothetical protein